MASTTIGKLRTIMSLETSQFRRDAIGAKSQIAGLTKGLKLMGGALAAAFGARAIVGQMKEMVNLYGQQEMAERHMAEGLKLAGDSSRAALDDFKRFAAEIQGVTTLGDEAVLELSALGASLGRLSGRQLKDVTKAAIGLSKVAGIDATSAMKLLSRAAQGGTVDFSRYGIVVDKTKSKQEQLNEVIGVGMEGFNIATSEAQTLNGQMIQLSNTIGDLKENLGGLIALPLKNFLEDINTMTKAGTTNPEVAKRQALAGWIDFFDPEYWATGESGYYPKQLREAAKPFRREQEQRDNKRAAEQLRRDQERAAEQARKAFMDSEIAASRQRVQERFKQKFGITGSEFFDFTARSGLYDFRNKLSNIRPISGLTKMLLGNFDKSQVMGPEHSGALIKGTAAEYSARLAATGRANDPQKKTEQNTNETAKNTKQMVELIRQYGLNQQQAVQIVEF